MWESGNLSMLHRQSAIGNGTAIVNRRSAIEHPLPIAVCSIEHGQIARFPHFT